MAQTKAEKDAGIKAAADKEASQGVTSPEAEQAAREAKAAKEAEQAKKEKESKEAQVRTASDKKIVKNDTRAKAAKADVSSEDVGSVRTVGWEKEQARIEKAREEEPTPRPAVEEFKGHKLEDRLESQPSSDVADTEKEVAKKERK